MKQKSSILFKTKFLIFITHQKYRSNPQYERYLTGTMQAETKTSQSPDQKLYLNSKKMYMNQDLDQLKEKIPTDKKKFLQEILLSTIKPIPLHQRHLRGPWSRKSRLISIIYASSIRRSNLLRPKSSQNKINMTPNTKLEAKIILRRNQHNSYNFRFKNL